MPSSGGSSIQSNVDPTHKSSYYVAFTEVIKVLKIKILIGCFGSKFLCIERHPEDGTSVLKHVGVFMIAYEYILYSE